jgi:hypothetical protein
VLWNKVVLKRGTVESVPDFPISRSLASEFHAPSMMSPAPAKWHQARPRQHVAVLVERGYERAYNCKVDSTVMHVALLGMQR